MTRAAPLAFADHSRGRHQGHGRPGLPRAAAARQANGSPGGSLASGLVPWKRPSVAGSGPSQPAEPAEPTVNPQCWILHREPICRPTQEIDRPPASEVLCFSPRAPFDSLCFVHTLLTFASSPLRYGLCKHIRINHALTFCLTSTLTHVTYNTHMAPKKRKGRRGARQPVPQRASSHDPYTSHNVHTTSDGYPVIMTNLVGAEEEGHGMGGGDTIIGRMEDFEDEDEFEVASLYPASQLPRGAMSTYRSGGGHFVTGDSRAMTSDLYCREYYMPNDELEQLRLTLLHQVFLHILDGELTLAPLEEPPTHVLDVGTGTGEWAIRMAEMYPECEVVGTDISAIAETESVPVNVFFEIEDAEDWDRPPDHYDMVHMRWLSGSFRDWCFIYDCAYYSLKPGGWIEVLDFDGFDGIDVCVEHFPPDSAIRALFRDIHAAAELAGRKLNMAHLNAPDFMDAGFVDIRVMEYSLPVIFGEPSVDKIWLMALIDGIEAMALRLLTEYMGWDAEECKAVCEQVARELANLTRNPVAAKNLVTKLRLVVARKPLQAPRSNAAWPAEEPLCLRPRRDGEAPGSEARLDEGRRSCDNVVEPHTT
ncbi:hypothetical protein TARUN_6585 [Trichoderma arundinaceum]|uniref:Methyltransferase n=1 Tax=Trichoderma arundinaceum TaxID=490622 RepID=A0A395NHY6_TRIAR|nr:hypothetical protein TARUN_6585 [Trichoderma arundinaceum]